MIHIEFAKEQIDALRYERYHHPHPRVQRKMEALFLKSQGLSHGEIGKLTGVSQVTLREYLRQYQDGGIDALRVINFHRPQSDLTAHHETIENEFRNNPPVNIKEAVSRIEELTGIKRSENRVREYLKKNRAETAENSTDSC
jgi:transposase